MPYNSGEPGAGGACTQTTLGEGEYSAAIYATGLGGDQNLSCMNRTLPVVNGLGTTSWTNTQGAIIYLHPGGDTGYNNQDNTWDALASGAQSLATLAASSGFNFIYALYELAPSGYINNAGGISSGATSVVLTSFGNSNYFPPDTAPPFTEQIESEIVTVTAQTTTHPGVPNIAQTITRGGTPAAHLQYTSVYPIGANGNFPEQADEKNIVCLLSNAAAGVGTGGVPWWNTNATSLIGVSHGCTIAANIRAMSAADKLAVLNSFPDCEADNGGSPLANATNWTILKGAGHSCPGSQDATATYPNDGSEPYGDNGELQRGNTTGGSSTSNLKVLYSPGCAGINTNANCNAGACGATGLGPPGGTSWTSLAQTAYNASPQGNLAGRAGTPSPIPPQFTPIHPPNNLPPMAIAGCNGDENVGEPQFDCFAQTSSIPELLITTGSYLGHLCDIQGNGAANCSNGGTNCYATDSRSGILLDTAVGIQNCNGLGLCNAHTGATGGTAGANGSL